MRFDDRLQTVLRQPPAGEAVARIQYRQLVDLLGKGREPLSPDQADAGYARLSELAQIVPAARRAAILREPSMRLSDPQFVAWLARSEPDVTTAAIAAARLDEDQWLDLIPALPVRARGFVRLRRDLGPRVEDLLARLGIADRALPAAAMASAEADPPDAGQPLELGEAQILPEQPTRPLADENGAAIGAIVRRIEAFRKSRPLPHAANLEPTEHAPRLPLGDVNEGPGAQGLRSFDFATDSEGRIVWCDRRFAPMVKGLSLAARDRDGPVRANLADRISRRQPLRAEMIEVVGAPAVAGTWQVDAAPRFDRPGGACVGYLGRMRRPAAEQATDSQEERESDADRMRQILHELRTPVNAIQGFAEVIQQQLFGPTPHEYRSLAAAIASDGARILAGFEELDRLVKLDSGAMALDPGTCDFVSVVESTVALLSSYTASRGSGFEFLPSQDDGPIVVAIGRDDAERLAWRLLAAIAGACAPGEQMRLRLRQRGDCLRLTIRLPAALADGPENSLFETTGETRQHALTAGAFGTGFALRLARAEARAAGGSLEQAGRKLRLVLPAYEADNGVNAPEINIAH